MDPALRLTNWTHGLDNMEIRRLGLCLNPHAVENNDGFNTSSSRSFFVPTVVLSTIYIMILRKDQLEASLHEETQLIQDGRLKEDNPLDLSETFRRLCEACRRGDLKEAQEAITEGANINARDQFDYTPLILVSTTWHSYKVNIQTNKWRTGELVRSPRGGGAAPYGWRSLRARHLPRRAMPL